MGFGLKEEYLFYFQVLALVIVLGGRLAVYLFLHKIEPYPSARPRPAFTTFFSSLSVSDMNRFLRFPFSPDAGLLLLRLWFGGLMLVLHGSSKLLHFADYKGEFIDFLGLGPTASLALAVFGEVVLAGLLVAGLLTRFAALGLVITMSVAFFIGHGGALRGDNSGELAFLYLGAYVVLLIAGAGRFSVDAWLNNRVPKQA
jgi:putative oxidoreductase